MKKIVIAAVLILIILCGVFAYLKNSDPLDVGAIATSTFDNKHILLVEVGNKSNFSKIHIEEVLINNRVKPSNLKLQISTPLKGFTISDSNEGNEEKGYIFKDLQNVSLLPNTTTQKQLEKANNGTATDNDKIYAISISDKDKIQEVLIKYRYFGLSYEKVVPIK
ncbi:hypothetical protein ACQKP0_15175 [Heyndrickxia sp. NPDC080065]|uniref:hypothetical protein n=1 Tax=Heyndrickxia sp. NPDC080065 TaxID=3390568 RepID=UPI003D06965C